MGNRTSNCSACTNASLIGAAGSCDEATLVCICQEGFSGEGVPLYIVVSHHVSFQMIGRFFKIAQ